MLGLLHDRLLWSLLDGLLGLAAVEEIIHAVGGFDTEREDLRRLGRVAAFAQPDVGFGDGVARLRGLHAGLHAGLAERLQLDSPTFDPE